MPMSQRDMPQNDITYARNVPRDVTYVASIATGHTAAAGATFELRARFYPGQVPVAISIWDARVAAEADNLVGPDQYGWADVPGAIDVFVVRTDGSGGIGLAGLDVTRSGGH